MTNNEWLNSLSVYDKAEFICGRELSNMITSMINCLSAQWLENQASPEYEAFVKSTTIKWLLMERT